MATLYSFLIKDFSQFLTCYDLCKEKSIILTFYNDTRNRNSTETEPHVSYKLPKLKQFIKKKKKKL